MRGAVRGATPLRNIRMCERAYNFSFHVKVWRGARNDCRYRHATRAKKQKLKLRIIRSVKFHVSGPILRA
jgi:hypothetical protein